MAQVELMSGYQSWNGPSSCDCEDSENHLHCDGPLKGTVVSFFHERSGKRSTGVVAFHWHYDGCIIEVDAADGERYSLHPDLGDRVRT